MADRWQIITKNGVDYHVDLWRGLFRDEIRVWQDVRPAAGGLIGRFKVKHEHSDAAFDLTVLRVQQEIEKPRGP